jgi:hypothetical protein
MRFIRGLIHHLDLSYLGSGGTRGLGRGDRSLGTGGRGAGSGTGPPVAVASFTLGECRPGPDGRSAGPTHPSRSRTGRSGAGGGPRPAPSPVYVFLNYAAVALGVAAKYFIQYSHGLMSFNWATLVSSAIVSAVLYPFIYKKICDPQAGGMQYFISFQHGFFFQTVLEEIQRSVL